MFLIGKKDHYHGTIFINPMCSITEYIRKAQFMVGKQIHQIVSVRYSSLQSPYCILSSYQKFRALHNLPSSSCRGLQQPSGLPVVAFSHQQPKIKHFFVTQFCYACTHENGRSTCMYVPICMKIWVGGYSNVSLHFVFTKLFHQINHYLSLCGY